MRMRLTWGLQIQRGLNYFKYANLNGFQLVANGSECSEVRADLCIVCKFKWFYSYLEYANLDGFENEDVIYFEYANLNRFQLVPNESECHVLVEIYMEFANLNGFTITWEYAKLNGFQNEELIYVEYANLNGFKATWRQV